ncbi:MAG: hypothetical protein AAB221_08265, partial [Bacteroidota bacterium]
TGALAAGFATGFLAIGLAGFLATTFLGAGFVFFTVFFATGFLGAAFLGAGLAAFLEAFFPAFDGACFFVAIQLPFF